jgi:hypothetical protein
MITIKKPDMTNCTEKQFNSWYWSDFNETCKKCNSMCKQSHAVIISCSKFELKREEVK